MTLTETQAFKQVQDHTQDFRDIVAGLKDVEEYVAKPTLADALRAAADSGVKQNDHTWYANDSVCALSAIASVLAK